MTTMQVVQMALSAVLVVTTGLQVWFNFRRDSLRRAEIQELREQVSRVARGAQRP